MKRLVIDTDPGIDDAHAILLAFAFPDVKVEALTTVAGNVSLMQTTANASIILDMLGEDAPIFPGCEDALLNPTPRRAISHGVDGLGDSGFPRSSRKVMAEHAVHALVRIANEAPGELALVALGPLTNIALATRLDPRLPLKYKSLVIMGGAIHAMGNSWSPAAEFNFSLDPEAAAIVLESWPEVTIVPWEAAMNYGISSAQFEEISHLNSPRANFFKKIFNNRYQKQIREFGTCYDADVLAMAVALEPDIVRRVEKRYIQVEVAGKSTRGQSVVDWFNITERPPNANLVLEVDRERFSELVRLSLK